MEEKKQIKISLKKLIFFVIIVILLILLLVYLQNSSNKPLNNQYYKELFYNNNNNININKVVSYSEYDEIIKNINSKSINKIKKYYSNDKCNYAILSYSYSNYWYDLDIIDYIEENNKIIVKGTEKDYGTKLFGRGYFFAIPTNMPVNTEIEFMQEYTIPNFPVTVDKPIIYLYPKSEIDIEVKLNNKDNITCSYPNYVDGFKVRAKPNGELVDLNTNRNLYALYYESLTNYDYKVKKEGFVVKDTDTIKFLEEKLEILGLTEREAEEFIVYWLPKLQENKYNYIRFATKEEIEKNMKIEFSVKPDTLIRVMMIYKGLDNPIDVVEQKLDRVNREGFVAVEWGGTKIK